MMIEKFKPYRSKKYTCAANGESCIRCGACDGTVAARHYNGIRQHALGKGRGIKCTDVATADLCHQCDGDFTEGMGVGGTEYSEEFLFYCLLTVHRRVTGGVIG